MFNHPERQSCCQRAACTTYRNCDVTEREREREEERKERGRRREGGSLQLGQSALSAAEGWTDRRCGDTDRGERERVGGEAVDGHSLVVVVGVGGTDGRDSPQLSRPQTQQQQHRRSPNAA